MPICLLSGLITMAYSLDQNYSSRPPRSQHACLVRQMRSLCFLHAGYRNDRRRSCGWDRCCGYNVCPAHLLSRGGGCPRSNSLVPSSLSSSSNVFLFDASLHCRIRRTWSGVYERGSCVPRHVLVTTRREAFHEVERLLSPYASGPCYFWSQVFTLPSRVCEGSNRPLRDCGVDRHTHNGERGGRQW